MAQVFITHRITGSVSNLVATGLEAEVARLQAACEEAGLDVRASVDVRLDPEPVAEPVSEVVPVEEPEA